MPRTDLVTAKQGPDTDRTLTGTAIDQPNGMRVLATKTRKTYVFVTNTSGATRVVTVRRSTAGVQDPAPADYSSGAIPAGGTGLLGPFSGRYVQSDGTLWLDFVAGHTGSVAPFEAV